MIKKDEERLSHLVKLLKDILIKEKQIKREIKLLIDKKLRPGY